MLRLYLVLFLILTLMRNQCNCQASRKSLELCHTENACFTFVHGTKLGWFEARTWCLSREADLASISSEEEQKFIEKKLPDKSGQSFWIGLNDTDNEGYFQWVDGTPFQFYFWGDDQPGGGKDENCVELYIDKSAAGNTEAQWGDRTCSAELYFICKKTKMSTAATARPQLVWISLLSLFIIALS